VVRRKTGSLLEHLKQKGLTSRPIMRRRLVGRKVHNQHAIILLIKKTMTTIKNLSTATQAAILCAALVLTFLFASTVQAATLYRSLDVGMSGSDVSALQTYLASDVSLYPQGLVTGYYGSLTRSAVMKFQTRHGISAVGRVGPITLAALNLRMSSAPAAQSDNAGAPIISGVSLNISKNGATISWNTNELAKGVVHFSTSPLTALENTNSVNLSGNTAMTDTNVRTSQSVSLSNLSADTVYYYSVYATDVAGNVSLTWPTSFRTTN